PVIAPLADGAAEAELAGEAGEAGASRPEAGRELAEDHEEGGRADRRRRIVDEPEAAALGEEEVEGHDPRPPLGGADLGDAAADRRQLLGVGPIADHPGAERLAGGRRERDPQAIDAVDREAADRAVGAEDLEAADPRA